MSVRNFAGGGFAWVFAALGVVAACDDAWRVRVAANQGWAMRVAEAEVASVEDIAVDGADRAYLVGSFAGRATFGAAQLASEATLSATSFACRVDPDMTIAWAASPRRNGFGHSQTREISRVALTPSGQVVILGNGDSEYGTFVGNLSVDGALQQMFSGFGDCPMRAGDLALDSTGESYLCGTIEPQLVDGCEFRGVNIDLGERPSSPTTLPFVTRGPETGWAAVGESSAWLSAMSLAVSPTGRVYVTGHFDDHFDFGGLRAIGHGGQDIFVLELGANGSPLSVREAGGPLADYVNDIAIDSQGAVYLTGQFQGTATFGALRLTSRGQDDAFVAKLSPQGTFEWAIGIGGGVNDMGKAIAIDAQDNVYVAGHVKDRVEVAGRELAMHGGHDVTVAKLSPRGQVAWVVTAGGADDDWAQAVAVTATGDVFVTGMFVGRATFGQIELEGSGEANVFLWKVVEAPR